MADNKTKEDKLPELNREQHEEGEGEDDANSTATTRSPPLSSSPESSPAKRSTNKKVVLDIEKMFATDSDESTDWSEDDLETAREPLNKKRKQN